MIQWLNTTVELNRAEYLILIAGFFLLIAVQQATYYKSRQTDQLVRSWMLQQEDEN